LNRRPELAKSLTGDDRDALTNRVYAALDTLPPDCPGARDHR
jgi:hypothetical protein